MTVSCRCALADAGIASAMLVGLAVPAQADTVDQTHNVVAPRSPRTRRRSPRCRSSPATPASYVKRVEAMLHITKSPRGSTNA